MNYYLPNGGLTSFIVTLIWTTFVAAAPSPRRTVIITGANSGVGFQATKQLAATNEWQVVMACRSVTKAEKAKASLDTDSSPNVEIAQLDLADLESIQSFCRQWGKRPIDVLACNAGIQRSTNALGKEKVKGELVPRTVQGLEETIGVNHVGHFYLTQQLLNNLKGTKGSRIVFTGSGVHDPDSPGGDVGSKATLGNLSGYIAGFQAPTSMMDSVDGAYDPDKAYKDSKLCNVITSIELARRLQSSGSKVTANVFNPGLIPTTGLFRDLNPLFVFVFTILTRYVFKVAETEEAGGQRLAYMIADPSLDGVSGGYFTGKTGLLNVTPSREAQDVDKAKQLWSLTEAIVKDNAPANPVATTTAKKGLFFW